MKEKRQIMVVGRDFKHVWGWLLDLAIKNKMRKDVKVQARATFGEMIIGDRRYVVCTDKDRCQGFLGEFVFLSGSDKREDFPELLHRAELGKAYVDNQV